MELLVAIVNSIGFGFLHILSARGARRDDLRLTSHPAFRLPIIATLAIVMLLGLLPGILPQSSAHAASGYLADEIGNTEISIDVEDTVQIVLWLVDVSELAGYDCAITVSGPGTAVDTAAYGDWFADGHTVIPGGGATATYSSAMLSNPTYISGSGDLVVFTIRGDDDGVVAINVDEGIFCLGDKDAEEIVITTPSTLYITVGTGGDSLQGGGEEEESFSGGEGLLDSTVQVSIEPLGRAEADIYLTEGEGNPVEVYIPYVFEVAEGNVTVSVISDHGNFAYWLIDSVPHEGVDDEENGLYAVYTFQAEDGLQVKAVWKVQITVDAYHGETEIDGVDVEVDGQPYGTTPVEAIWRPAGEAIQLSIADTCTDPITEDNLTFHHWKLLSGGQVSYVPGMLPFSFSPIADVIADAYYGREIHVGPDDLIQDKIDEAVDGDTVIVSDGVYMGYRNTDLTFGGSAITLRSENGYEHCIIFCAYKDGVRGFTFNTGEGAASVLQGFTICGGIAPANQSGQRLGGAILCSNASPTIVGNRMTDNYAQHKGGGIAWQSGTVTLVGNVIEYNRTEGTDATWGGGAYIEHANVAAFAGNFIHSNSVEHGHGGGAALSNAYDEVVLQANTFIDNRGNNGGGIYSQDVIAVLAVLELRDNLICNNFSPETARPAQGGGVYISGHRAFFDGNTIAQNEAEYQTDTSCSGGGVYLYHSGSAQSPTRMINCVIWQNSAYANPQVGAGGTTVYEISYTDIQGGASGDGNMNQDPLFADPEERDYHLKSQGGRFTPTGQWVLDQTTSPCIDAGNPEAEYDQESAPNGGRLNMGAYGNTVEASRSPFIVAFSVSDQTSHSEAITDSYEVDVSITPSAPSGQGWSVAGYRILEAGQTEPEWSQDAPSTYDIQGAQGIQIHLQAQVKWQKDQAPDQIAVAEATIWYSLWAVITEFFVTDQTSSSKLYTNSSTVDVHLSTLRPENVNITGYAITEDEFEPTTWDSVAPSDYEITGSTGEVTLYAWLKDSNDFVVHTPCTIYYVTQAPAVSSLDFSRFAARYALGS